MSLTVVDAAGASHRDTVQVKAKLKNANRRPCGSDANRSFASAVRLAGSGIANGTGGKAAMTGFAYASAASACGDAAGEFLRWGEGQSEDDALIAYAELRAVQRTYGQAAAQALLSAYGESGDESLLSAYAADGSAYAEADLTKQ